MDTKMKDVRGMVNYATDSADKYKLTCPACGYGTIIALCHGGRQGGWFLHCACCHHVRSVEYQDAPDRTAQEAFALVTVH